MTIKRGLGDVVGGLPTASSSGLWRLWTPVSIAQLRDSRWPWDHRAYLEAKGDLIDSVAQEASSKSKCYPGTSFRESAASHDF